MKKKNILLILTGGTFGMAEGTTTSARKPGSMDGNFILDAVPEIRKLANIEWVSIFDLDSSDISPRHWENIGTTVSDHYNNYDGIVVIHGTDTMVYSAAAMSFMIKSTEKPIIFTGSQQPLASKKTDAKGNLINAVKFATQDIPEVCISFGKELFRGNRAKKVSIDEHAAFHSYNFKLKKGSYRPKGKPTWSFGFNTNVALLKIFPGMEASLLKESLMSGKVRGLILEGFGSGNLPEFDESWLDLIGALRHIMIPTVITSQCAHGYVNLKAYENGLNAIHKGAISCGDITTEAAVVKLMFALNRHSTYNDVVAFMRNNYCGEMS